MAENDLIGVVTVTYNSASVLEEFLKCASAQTYSNFLLFAIDNASTDETVSMLRICTDSRLRIIVNPDNKGIAEGNNQGILAALESGCASVLLLNNDTTFDKDMFAALARGFEQYSAQMTCPKIMYFDEPDRIWAAGGDFQPWFAYRVSHRGHNQLDAGQFDQVSPATYVPTCCVLIKREVFEKIGLMDARYFVYVDDVDFMYRAMKKGVKLIYLPGNVMYHKVGGLTGGQESTFSIRFNTRNRVYFLIKHFGLLRSLPVLLFYQAIFAVRFLTGRLSRREYGIKQKAVIEGISFGRS